MKEKFLKKFIITSIIITFFIITYSYNVMATNVEEYNDTNKYIEILDESLDESLNEIFEEKPTIIKYDRKTNETTEVDMEELEKVLELNIKASKNETTAVAPKRSLMTVEPISNKFSNKRLLGALKVNSIPSTVEPVNTYSFPYRQTCRITYSSSSGPWALGTASIVGPKVALTCAHCVFNGNSSSDYYPGWTIYPGYAYSDNYGAYIYYGTATGWDSVYYASEYFTTSGNTQAKYDWAICVLQSDESTYVGNLGAVSYSSNSELNGTNVMLTGYPGDSSYGFNYQSLQQYKSNGYIDSVNDLSFRSTHFTCNGFSGGPVVRTSDNKIVGVNQGVYSNSGKAHVVRISQYMINVINYLNSNT